MKEMSLFDRAELLRNVRKKYEDLMHEYHHEHGGQDGRFERSVHRRAHLVQRRSGSASGWGWGSAWAWVSGSECWLTGTR